METFSKTVVLNTFRGDWWSLGSFLQINSNKTFSKTPNHYFFKYQIILVPCLFAAGWVHWLSKFWSCSFSRAPWGELAKRLLDSQVLQPKVRSYWRALEFFKLCSSLGSKRQKSSNCFDKRSITKKLLWLTTCMYCENPVTVSFSGFAFTPENRLSRLLWPKDCSNWLQFFPVSHYHLPYHGHILN